MNKTKYAVTIIIALIIPFCPCASTPVKGNIIPVGTSTMDFSFTIDNTLITLTDGISEIDIVPGAAAKETTKYFGGELVIDLNNDGVNDRVLLITQESGGSGTFFYLVGVLIIDEKYYGTNAIFIGDRISPQKVYINPDNHKEIVLSYGDRTIDDSPMNVVTRKFEYKGNKLMGVY